ncbi:intraflagellar transport protein 46 homolog isoform X2 [Hydractinia symbiolongicarpus]|nr:intraflagellar transport protein 46 homolog isoform X2 [Hydractinia symbiolongicarpus]
MTGQMKEPIMGSDDDDEFEHDDEDFNRTSESKKSSEVQQRPPSKPQQGAINSRPRPPGGHVIEASDDDDDNDDDQSDSTEDEDEKVNDTVEGIYDPADYEHLPVSQEVKELFQYITRYTPQAIDLDYKLKPFIPDYIPAVGDIDAFLKVTRPDGKPETLGLQILDEPSAKQSDPTVLDLQLRSISKQTSAKQVVVRSIEEPEKNPKAIDNWITSISDLHRQKPPQNVHYTKNMPDIETLMQEWPPEFEEMLKNVNLPSADLDCELTEYIDIICSVLDIPIYKNRIQSLHVLFTLYSEFKNSQHFNQLAHDNLLSNELKHSQPLRNHKSMTHNDGQSLSFE